MQSEKAALNAVVSCQTCCHLLADTGERNFCCEHESIVSRDYTCEDWKEKEAHAYIGAAPGSG